MKGLGRAPVLVALGIVVVIGCGGRTGSLDAEYEEPGGAGGSSAGTGIAGTSRGGTKPRGGAGGSSAGYGGVAGTHVGGYGGYVAGHGGVAGGYPGGYGGYIGGYGGSIIFGGYGGGVVGGFAGAPPDDCLSCLRDNCSPQFLSCFQDFGCLSIFACMQGTGCQAFECYTDQYCKGVIDEWGGPNGKPMSELLQTFTCAFQSGCQCQ